MPFFVLTSFAFMDFIVTFAFYIRSLVYTMSVSSTFAILGLFFQGCIYVLVPFLAIGGCFEGESEGSSSAHEEKRLHEGEGQTNGNRVSGSEIWGGQLTCVAISFVECVIHEFSNYSSQRKCFKRGSAIGNGNRQFCIPTLV